MNIVMRIPSAKFSGQMIVGNVKLAPERDMKIRFRHRTSTHQTMDYELWFEYHALIDQTRIGRYSVTFTLPRSGIHTAHFEVEDTNLPKKHKNYYCNFDASQTQKDIKISPLVG